MGLDFFPEQTNDGCIPNEDRSPGDTHPPLDEVFTLAYEELKRLARSVRRSEANASITPTALVNEAWIKLSCGNGVAWSSPIHFKRIAARAMRQVLVELARRRQTQIRGNDVQRVTFDEAVPLGLHNDAPADRELLALNDALEHLARLEPRQAALVEARFFGGLEMEEIAELLGISAATALRDWRSAKAWMAAEIRRSLAAARRP